MFISLCIKGLNSVDSENRKDMLCNKAEVWSINWDVWITLCSQHLLDCVSRQRVEKQGNEQGEENEKKDFENGPLVVVPNNVSDGFDWIEEPHEWWVWSPGK